MYWILLDFSVVVIKVIVYREEQLVFNRLRMVFILFFGIWVLKFIKYVWVLGQLGLFIVNFLVKFVWFEEKQINIDVNICI